MELTGNQFEWLEKALKEAYPSKTKLERMVRITFDRRLNEIAEGANHTERIDSLIEWSEAQGNVADLIRGAHRYNPSNRTLKRFCEGYCQELLAAACLENLSDLKAETVRSFVRLPLVTIPVAQIVTTGLSVLPSGVHDDRSDIDLVDFENDKLIPVVRLYGFLRLALAKFTRSRDQPTLLRFARELCSVLVTNSPVKPPLAQWVQQAETEYGVSSPSASALPTSPTRQGTLEASLMITMRLYSKQQSGKSLQYQVNGCLYFDQITGSPSPRLAPRPPLELSLPEAQSQLGIVCPWTQVPKRTNQFLEVAIDQITHQLKQELGYRAYKLTVELFLPLEYMGVKVDQWPRPSSRSSGQDPLGKDYGVIVRFCDRINDDERYNEICLTWDKLQALLQSPDGLTTLHEHIESPEDLAQYTSWRQLETKLKQKLGLKLCCGLPESAIDQKGLFEAVLYGDVPVAVWTRSADIIDINTNPEQPLDLSESLKAFLAAECFCNPASLSELLKRARQAAWAEESTARKGRCLGDHVAFLLDNPDRLPISSPLAS